MVDGRRRFAGCGGNGGWRLTGRGSGGRAGGWKRYQVRGKSNARVCASFFFASVFTRGLLPHQSCLNIHHAPAPNPCATPILAPANHQVKELCTANRTRPGCTACLESFDANKTYGNCDLLGVWGDICKSEPSGFRGSGFAVSGFQPWPSG